MTGFWSGRRVFLTGHTGFKGGWLALWLKDLGAELVGYALDPPTTPSLYDVLGLAAVFARDLRADIGDAEGLAAALREAAPEVVFHLAAQPLVREGHADPLTTFRSNVMGTVHLLEAVRHCPTVRAVVVVTTDKVYANREWVHPYREPDRLGGSDPYSASKAAAEGVVTAYRESFFAAGGASVGLASARAGNVIGGGDWARDRLVPDCLRAFARGEAVALRNPKAVRPWQHVLEPLGGYLRLAESLWRTPDGGFSDAWNFGPGETGDATVGEVAARLAGLWGDDARVRECPEADAPREAGLLRLDVSKAVHRLGWRPRWDLDRALEKTLEWHRAWLAGRTDMRALSLRQIRDYASAGPGTDRG